MALVISAFCLQEHQECIQGHSTSPPSSASIMGAVSLFGFVTVCLASVI